MSLDTLLTGCGYDILPLSSLKYTTVLIELLLLDSNLWCFGGEVVFSCCKYYEASWET